MTTAKVKKKRKRLFRVAAAVIPSFPPVHNPLPLDRSAPVLHLHCCRPPLPIPSSTRRCHCCSSLLLTNRHHRRSPSTVPSPIGHSRPFLPPSLFPPSLILPLFEPPVPFILRSALIHSAAVCHSAATAARLPLASATIPCARHRAARPPSAAAVPLQSPSSPEVGVPLFSAANFSSIASPSLLSSGRRWIEGEWTGLIGGLFLPMLGALPDAMLTLGITVLAKRKMRESQIFFFLFRKKKTQLAKQSLEKKPNFVTVHHVQT